ncbi:MAG: Flp family type IVb pilin [Sphingomonadaceae bacterium]
MGEAIRRLLASVRQDERGVSAVEYALIISMVVLAVFGAISALGSSTSGTWNDVSTQFTKSNGGS